MADNSSITTVILIRHAEKGTSPANDPHLSANGLIRANELVRILGGAGIKSVYTSLAARTKETARPLAVKLGISPVSIDKAADLRTHILGNHAGKTVLVVGHSNTVPQLIGLLGSAENFTINESEFDNLFILSRQQNGTARTVHLKYGNPT